MGDSDPASDGDYSVPAFAADVDAVADALGLDAFVLIGHSFGGSVAAAYAGRRPDRLAGLVFADAAADLSTVPASQLGEIRRGFRPESYERFTREWFEGILRGAREETRAAVLESLARTRPEVFQAATFAAYAYRADGDLRRYSGPALSIASMLRDSRYAVHRNFPDVPMRAVENASHWLMMDRPAAFHRILQDFVDGVGAVASR